jgi:cytochrome P450
MLTVKTVHRDARYFSPDPEAFWPERWLPEGPKLAESRGESFVHDTSAFAPFSFGTPSLSFYPLYGHQAEVI